MTGSAPNVTLNPPSIECNAGDTITVVATVTDADTRTEVVRGTNQLGIPTVVTETTVDTATISAARWSTSGDLARVSGLTVTAVAVYGAGNLEIAVRDAEGNETIATCVVTVKAPAPTMLIGSDRSPIDMKVYPANAYYRLYGPNGQPTTAALNAVPAGIDLVHMSYKKPSNAPAIKAVLDKLARPVLWESLHEPDRSVDNGGPVGTAFRADAAILRDTVRPHPNGHYVRLVRTFMRYSQAHNRPARQWEDFWDDYVDVIGFDCEWDSGFRDMLSSGYPDPEAFFAIPVAAAKKVGKPLVIPELGWPQIAADKDGSGLADWYQRCLVYLRSTGCLAVAAYDSTGQTSPTGTYVLTGKPLAAWQKLMVGS